MPDHSRFAQIYPTVYVNSDPTIPAPEIQSTHNDYSLRRHEELSAMAFKHYQNAFNGIANSGPLPTATDMTGLTKAPETFKGDLPETIICVKASPRGACHISLSCEDSTYSRIHLYRRYEKDYDKYVYVRADIHRQEMLRVADQANELIVLGVENKALKEEVLELRHLLENS